MTAKPPYHLPIVQGPTVPVYAPLHPDGSLNLDFIPHYGDVLLKKGARNLYVNGTSGEFFSLSVSERKDVLEAWHRHHGTNFQLVAHVGACSLADTEALASHAASLGVCALAVVPPFYSPASGVDALVRYFQRVAKVSKGLPLWYYHIPFFSRATVSLEEFLEAALDRVPGFCGMKFTDKDADLLERCQMRFGDRMQILCGNELLYRQAVSFGVRDGIFALYNFFEEPLHSIRLAGEPGATGDILATADRAHELLQTFFKVFYDFAPAKAGIIPLLKDCGRLHALPEVGPSLLPSFGLQEEDLQLFRLQLSKLCPRMFTKC